VGSAEIDAEFKDAGVENVLFYFLLIFISFFSSFFALFLMVYVYKNESKTGTVSIPIPHNYSFFPVRISFS